ncbi:GTPase IMAP family member 4-like [Myotis myotis]|uniref:GTPase IMAP family member 4-like n=1 Tax=Myotis myotis TaxID=51298 RepID=UPI00174BB1DD|nr:GTPase IMAP family member 4-like [Myotis myotis]
MAVILSTQQLTVSKPTILLGSCTCKARGIRPPPPDTREPPYATPPPSTLNSTSITQLRLSGITSNVASFFKPQCCTSCDLLFTRKDDLDGMELRDYLKEAPEGIQDLMKQFKDRHCEFNNKATGAEQEDQRTQLLDLVQRIVKQNKGGFYTNKIYQRAEVEIQKQIQAIQENYRARLKKEKRQLKEEYEEKIRKLEVTLEQEMKKAEMEREFEEREKYYLFMQQNARGEVESQKGMLDLILKGLRVIWREISSLFKED